MTAGPSPSEEPGFGALLRHYRCAAGMSQGGLAERTSLSVGAISTLERSTRRGPQRQTLELIANALNLSPPDRARLETAAALGRTRSVRNGVRTPAAYVPNNLPHASTSFHGRDDSFETLRRALQSRRLVTLLGTAGVGKTRLAIEASRRFARGKLFPDGVRLVELGSLLSPALLEATLARELGVRATPNAPLLDTVIAAIGEEKMLVILDNCEHLLGASADVARRLLRGCPNIAVLVTTREALRIDGECVLRIDPLVDEAALELFSERLADADFKRYGELDQHDRGNAAMVCARLDGIPLALELAAAHARELSLDQIVRDLNERVSFLGNGRRTTEARTQTLRGTIEWSFALLTPAESEMFAPLGLFASSFKAAAAAQLCATNDERTRAVLSGLVAKSLLSVLETDGETRYRMLETIRAYALERLRESAEPDRYEERFARHFLAVAREADDRYGRISHATFLSLVEPDLDNFRFALEWSLGRLRDPQLGAELAGTLGWCFRQLSLFAEGTHWCRKALDEGGLLASQVRGRVHMALSFFEFNSGELPRALDAARAATAAYREANDLRGISWALTQECYCYYMLGDADEASRSAIVAIAKAREAGDDLRLAGALNAIAVTIPVDRAAERLLPLEEAVRCYRAAGDPKPIVPLSNLAEAHFAVGNFEEALARGQEIVAITRDGGDRSNLASALTNVAGYAVMLDDFEYAKSAGCEALTLVRHLGKSLNAMCALQHLASVWAHEGEWSRAARLCGASNRLYADFAMQREFTEQSLYDRTIAELRTELGEKALARRLAEGARLATECAINEALSLEH